MLTGRHIVTSSERDMPQEVFNVHGPSSEFPTSRCSHRWLKTLTFIGDAPLVIHNAMFDIGFINAELDRMSRAAIPATG